MYYYSMFTFDFEQVISHNGDVYLEQANLLLESLR